MSVKKILVIAGSLVVIIGLTIGILFIIKPQPGTQGVETARGIKPTDNFVFNDMSGVKVLPVFSQLPSGTGWTKVTSTEDTSFVSVKMTNSNGCTFTAQSQQIPLTNSKLKDYALSKDYASIVADSEQGTLTDVYVIKIKTTAGDADFYSGVYSSKISLTHPEGTTPATEGGVVSMQEPDKIYIAVRSIASSLKTTSSVKSTTLASDAKYKPGEIITLGDMIPAIVLKYSCKADVFDVGAAQKFVQQIKLDLSPTLKPSTADGAVGK